MWPTILAWVWQNKRLVLEIVGIIILVVVIWWFGFHNPAKIEQLETDKAALKRQVQAGQEAITLLQSIQQGKVVNNAAVQSQITSLHHKIYPSNGVFLPAGRVPRSSMQHGQTAH